MNVISSLGQSQTRWRRWLPWFGALVGLATLAWLLRGFEFDRFLAILADADIRYVALGPLAVAGGLFLAATLLTQVLSGQVTPVVLAPIAIAAAEVMGADPRGVALAVALGSSTAFLTPISHSSNMLVMGPGGYKFNDYARVGLPLTLILFVVAFAGLWWFWGIG